MTSPPSPGEPLKRFGWFSGVFTPSILTILGVIMFLRMGWVVGNAGLLGAIAIVVISHVITIATGLSVSSIATNRVVGAGGAYNIISREWRTWKRYKAGRAQDVFVYDLRSNEIERITEFEGTDNFPMWIGDRIYFTSVRFSMSIDGGRSLVDNPPRGGGDTHDIWIDPTNRDRVMVADDGGLTISLNRGRTFDRIVLPIAQMYHVAVDDEIPYNVYGNRQDGWSYRGPSNSLQGAIPLGLWESVGGCESGFGIPDPEWGERVCAAVVLRAGAAADAEGLREALSERLARYKVPRTIHFVPDLPRTGSGKIAKRALRARWS